MEWVSQETIPAASNLLQNRRFAGIVGSWIYLTMSRLLVSSGKIEEFPSVVKVVDARPDQS